MAAAGARQCVQPLLALLLLLSISNASGAAAAPPQEAAPAARALPAWVPTHGAITAVPGFGSASGGAAPPSRMYGGYVPVGRSKQLYYIMVESERDPANDPVV
jgi:serine carboxypeptidase-like clade 1